MVELFKELRHIKPQALHFYRFYMFFSFETSAPGSAEIMLHYCITSMVPLTYPL